jgi:hypothetical protein
MSLWDVLTLASGGAAAGGALAAAKFHGVDSETGYLVAAVVGIVSALASIALVRALGTRILGRADMNKGDEPSNRTFYLVYLIAVVWIPIAGVIGSQAAAAVLRAAW